MTLSAFAYPDWLLPVVLWSAAILFTGTVIVHALRPKYQRIYGGQAILWSLWHALLPSIWVQIYLWLALVVLWTPVWWLAVLITELTGVWSATGWFLVTFVAFYGAWLIRGLTGNSVNRRFEATLDRDNAPADPAKRVAVIGAGMAGLVAAKELKEEGHNVVVFERTAGPGGVWASSKARGGVAWGSTMTSSGALNTVFSDSPTQIFHADNERWPHHFNRAQFLGFLEEYGERHHVFEDSLRCNAEVIAMSQLPGERWRLTVRDNTTDTTSEEEFDAVTVCTGLNKQSYTPEVAGQDSFPGTQKHVEDYRPTDAAQYKDRRVLVMGLGETSSDLVKDLVEQGARHVYVSQRGGTWVIPREVANLPPDHCETRLVHDGPMFHRVAMLVCGAAPAAFWSLVRPSRHKAWSLGQMLRILVLHHPDKWNLWRIGSLNWTKSDNIYPALDTGRASLHRDVERLEGNKAKFVDGSEAEIDDIVYATGYRPGGSLLPSMTGEGSGAAPVPKNARDLYKLTIPPHHPNVAMIGFARGQIGAITLSTELQARWWALLVSGKRTLPPPEEMAEFAAAMRHNGRRFHQPTRTTACFAYSIARNEIGCEPDMFKLFLTDRRLWLAVLMGPVCANNFRFRGPRAKPDRAREQLLMPQAVQSDEYIDSVDLYMNTLPLATLLVPAYGFWSRLIPWFPFQNATRSYI